MKKIFVVAALITGSPLLAQKDSTATLNEVVVTANKFPNKTSLTGKVVVTISRQDIERAGSRDLAQLLNEQGGIYINGANSNAGKDKSVYLRGGRVEHTLITIDGVPVYDASGIGSNFDIRNIAPEQVERIEILKGSQGTLYGSDAIAGVINIITRKGGGKPLTVSGMLSAGSYGTVRSNINLAGKNKKLDYNIGYGYFNTKGISEAEQHPDSTKTFDKDGYKQNTLQASLGVQVSANFRMQPYLRFTKNSGGYDQQGYVDEASTYAADNLQTGIRNEISIGQSKLNLLYQYTKTDRDYTAAFSSSNYKSGEHFAESFITHPFGNFKLTGGVDFRSSNTNQTSTLSFIKPIGSDSAKQNQVGIYSALAFNTEKGFNAEAGVRFNRHSIYGGNAAFNVNPSYLISNQWKVFGNISSGYKTPGLYQLFSEFGNTELNPETSLNFETGVQYFTKNEKASMRATYFNRQVKNLITFFFDPVTFNLQYVNQDSQKDHGVELDAKIKIGDKVQVKAFYSYLHGKD